MGKYKNNNTSQNLTYQTPEQDKRVRDAIIDETTQNWLYAG